ncbi:ribosomal-processing cysteine protease Prp [Ornithinibacillus sp. BX22]|uniref:Ribosomal processing cysteine protease Prp n=2 Tax=Ornithinibacillus TaxID=484508 RepID=A0A923L6V3_9BACI|nr:MULTISPECIES: ribosomal-processing cysteine protease Prp [Ornithinibacillus]MBC5637590.1 ribosomal-processing cysteine protease Prp [Ornithinibacillus hominis]MBS3679457.1 ribosomal-processing cysteine protease Prp [Ornithinibacillus massiliensis]
MIKITVYRDNNQIKTFELSGHAESGPYGYDLVCAGVSAVSFGAVNAVLELTDIDLAIEQGSEGGYLRVSIPDSVPSEIMDNVQLLFEGMIVSLQTIERDYSQFIMIQSK